MAKKLKSDRVLFMTTMLLVCAGVVMVYSASAVLALDRFDQSYHFLTKQALLTVLGLALMAIAMRVDYRLYRNELFIWSTVGVIVLLLVAVLFSAPVNNASRWLNIGGMGIQPSEFAKLVAILFAAATLERRMHRIDELSYSFLPIAIVVAPMVALILFQPDYGTAITLMVIVATMVVAAGLHYRYLLTALAAATPVLWFVLISESYRRRRLTAFLDPWADPLGDGFQLIQSLIAVGTGGLVGRGLMGGVQKLFYLPEPHSDFIYSVIGEELGLLGTTAILACFCVIAWRGLSIAARAEDSFGSLLAVGLTTMICVQALVNISVTLGLLPTKGIPLPLVSAGGSSLLVSLFGIGVMLNISQRDSG